MNLAEMLKRTVYLDGGMGTMLQSRGLEVGHDPSEWNFTHPEEVFDVHRQYIEAGAEIISSNSFGANIFRYGKRCADCVAEAVKIAKRAAAGRALVALDIGPTGKLLKPLGDLEFEDAVEAFKVCVRAGVAAGADLIFIETMNDIYEAKAAVIAAKEECSLPVFASLVFGADGKTLTGSSPEVVCAVLEGLKVDALGLNCSLSPAEMTPVVKRFSECSSTPVIVKPNAGLPAISSGASYSVDEREFALTMRPLVALGARLIGGCCGTTPRYIAELKQKTCDLPVTEITRKNITAVTSYSEYLTFGGEPKIIGERINPTGKKLLKEAILSGNIDYILGEAAAQEEAGAHALDVNVGLAGTDEKTNLVNAVRALQTVTSLPLQIDTSSPSAMEAAMRIYNGKPLVNSVNGKLSSIKEVFPLVKKYGGTVIALTLDEGGVPETAEGRIAIAKKILRYAKRYGVEKKDIIFDTLATAVAADKNAALAALGALKYIREKLGVNVSLGVSNISFGLPHREYLNAEFLSMAMAQGLSAAILNPLSGDMIRAVRSFCALSGYDEGCLKYVAFCSENNESKDSPQSEPTDGAEGLRRSILRGLKAEAARIARDMTALRPPEEIINGVIVPALDEVGRGFEEKRLFLPQLMMSAEAAAVAFEEVKRGYKGVSDKKKLKFVLATVKGDVHDIGKNIVKSLVENYGFTVYDLGKDVPPEKIVEEVKKRGAEVCGLSALMTTTVDAMEQTVKLLKAECPRCKVVCGGAVLTEEYAKKIGADEYSKDAMACVRYLEELEREL